MSDVTRVVRLRADINRGAGSNDGTYATSTREHLRITLVDHATLFNHHQRRLAEIVRSYPKLGVVVFALHAERGLAGHLWLESTESLRAGTIGRHQMVDLYLPDDETVSLRHLLVLVNREEVSNFRVRVLDLATPQGFHAESGSSLRMLEGDGPLVFQAASYSFFVFPTGVPPPWDPSAPNPWLTLPRRAHVATPRDQVTPRRRRADGATSVTFGLEGLPAHDEQLVQGHEVPVGVLRIATQGLTTAFPVGARALERGIIIGRYERCIGEGLATANDVSRVHAVLLSHCGQTFIVDAGSTNGIVSRELDVKCEAVTGALYHLGAIELLWTPQ